MPVRCWGMVVCLVVGQAVAAPKPPPTDFAALERVRLAELELTRDLRGDVLVSRARLHGDPTVRARALLALARIQDPSTAPTVVEALRDPVPAVRAEAAFAAREIALAWEPPPDETREALARGLLGAEAKETDGSVRLAQVDALGRVRTASTLERLVVLLGGPVGQPVDPAEPRSDVPVRAAIALGVAARAKAKVPEAARPGLERLAGSLFPVARWSGVYALGQMKTPAGRPVLLAALRDDDAEVRAIAARGLTDVVAPEDTQALKPLLRDPDGRVAAESVRSLVALAARCRPGPCPSADALGQLDTRAANLGAGTLGQSVPPLLALAQAQVPESGRKLLARLRSTLRTSAETAPEPVRFTAASLDCRLAAALDRQRGWLDETLRCGQGRIPEWRRLRLGLEAVAGSPRLAEARVQKPLLPYFQDRSPSVRAAALGVATVLKSPDLVPAVRPLLQDPDPIVRAAAVETLAALGDQGSGPAILAGARTAGVDVATSYADALIKLKPAGATAVLRQWLTSPHVHLRQEAARALTILEGTPVRAPAIPDPGDAPRAPAVPSGTGWRLETAHGPVVISPDLDAAPATVAQLSRLAGAGSFKALTFHRIVPDFVAQGGDPRGDGEGGPGFTLPCEVSPRTYLRGTVGMALAGKDTGGSQFFISVSPQPHLDGRYTVIGTVTSGMDVIDGLVEGDPLLDWVVLTP